MTTASEADLIRRHNETRDRLEAELKIARAELSREATAAAGLQEELRVLRRTAIDPARLAQTVRGALIAEYGYHIPAEFFERAIVGAAKSTA